MKNNIAQKNIPQGWQEILLGSFLLKEKGGLPKILSDERINDTYAPYLTINTINGGNPKYAPKNSGVMAEKDDLLVVADGSGSGRLYRGYDGLVSSTFFKISSTDKNKITNDFLSVVFSHLNFMRPEFRKGGAIPHFDYRQLDNIKILLPSKTEQQKIADILGAVDEDIKRTQKVIEATEKLKKGLMQQLFARGIGHTKFKKTKLGEIPEEWEIIKFIEFVELQRGFDLPALKRTGGDYPLVSSNGVTDSHNEYKVKGPGVITGRSGTLGNVMYVEDNFWPLNTTLYIKNFNNNYPKYVYYFLHNFKLNRFHSGTGVPTLNRNNVHVEDIAVPKNINEQKEIVEILSAVDDKISINKKLKNKITLLKKGLMQDLLSGKVRVK